MAREEKAWVLFARVWTEEQWVHVWKAWVLFARVWTEEQWMHVWEPRRNSPYPCLTVFVGFSFRFLLGLF